MSAVLYIESSAVLRALLDRDADAKIVELIADARANFVSRLTHLECARAIHRLRARSTGAPPALEGVERSMSELWDRCETLELDAAVFADAARVAPGSPLRTLDALHLAAFRRLQRASPDARLLSCDERLCRLVAAHDLALPRTDVTSGAV